LDQAREELGQVVSTGGKEGVNLMKKGLSFAMALVLVFCFAISASAVPGEQNGNSLSIVQPSGGAYVIVTSLKQGELDFAYGWNNAKHFASPPLGYWIGVYDVTSSHYVWAEDIRVEPGLKMIKLRSLGTALESGKEYAINFFVRDSYAGPVTNVAEITVEFTAP